MKGAEKVTKTTVTAPHKAGKAAMKGAAKVTRGVSKLPGKAGRAVALAPARYAADKYARHAVGKTLERFFKGKKKSDKKKK
jgi:hypothetical protein